MVGLGVMSIMIGVILLTSFMIPYASAKPVGGTIIDGNTQVKCSSNNGVLKCTVRDVDNIYNLELWNDPNRTGNKCDESQTERHRSSVDTRTAEVECDSSLDNSFSLFVNACPSIGNCSQKTYNISIEPDLIVLVKV